MIVTDLFEGAGNFNNVAAIDRPSPAAAAQAKAIVQKAADNRAISLANMTRSVPMDQNINKDVEENYDDEPAECWTCRGTGEGQHEGQTCSVCHGTGVEPGEPDDDFDDFDLDENDAPWPFQQVNELSNEKLTQYKKAAGADATAADRRGDFERGNKRFRGITTATKKQFSNDVKKHYASREQGVAEGLLEEVDRRGFLKGLGAAALAGAADGAKARTILSPEDLKIVDDYLNSYYLTQSGSGYYGNDDEQQFKQSFNNFIKKYGAEGKDLLNKKYKEISNRVKNLPNDQRTAHYSKYKQPNTAAFQQLLDQFNESIKQGVAEGFSLNSISKFANIIPNFANKLVSVGKQEATETWKMLQILNLKRQGKATPAQIKFMNEQWKDIAVIALGVGLAGQAAVAGAAHAGTAGAVTHVAKDELQHSLIDGGLEYGAEVLAAKFGIDIVKKIAHALSTSSGRRYDKSQEVQQDAPIAGPASDANVERMYANARGGFGGVAEEKVRLDPKCWTGKHKEGTKIKGGVRVNNCVPNESVDEAANAAQQAAIAINMKKQHKKPKGVNEVAPDPKHLQRHGREADQTWPDDSNSLSKRYNDRDIVVPNLDAVRAGTAPKNKHYQSTPYHTSGVKVATKIKPSITKTTVDRLDKNTNIPNFLKKSGVTESTTKIQESVTTTLTQRMQSVNKKLTTTVKGMS